MSMSIEQIRRLLRRSGWTYHQWYTGRIQAKKRGLDGTLMAVHVCMLSTMCLLNADELQQKLNSRECRCS
jgi:hypothetical protein